MSYLFTANRGITLPQNVIVFSFILQSIVEFWHLYVSSTHCTPYTHQMEQKQGVLVIVYICAIGKAHGKNTVQLNCVIYSKSKADFGFI